MRLLLYLPAIRTAIRKAFGLVRWLVVLEIGIWRSLCLLLARRVSGQAAGAHPFRYSREVGPIIGAFIFVSVIELVVVHLLLPWETIRLIVDVISIWGLLWMVGYLASMRVFPHMLDDSGLRIRFGTTLDVRLPWEAVKNVRIARRRVATSRGVDVERGDAGTVASIGVLKQTRIDAVLQRPTTVSLPNGPEEISELRFYVDDPAAFVARARELMPTSRSSEA